MFLSASSGGLRFGAALKRLGLCEDVRTMTIDFVSLMPDGGGLWHSTQVATDIIAERTACHLEASGNPLRRVSSRFSEARCEAYFRRLISQEIYYLIAMCLVAERESPGVERIALARVGDLAPILGDMGSEWFKNTRFLAVPHFRSSILVYYPRFLWNHFRLFRLWPERKSAIKNYSVAIQSFWGSGNGDVRSHRDLWWYRSSQLGPERAVVFFDSPKRAAEDTTLDSLEEHGYRCRILRKDANNSSRKTARYSLSSPSMLIRDMYNAEKLWLWWWRVPAGRWRFVAWLRAVTGVRRWQAFMETEGVRAIFDVSETASENVSLACDVVGAIKIGMHWGDYPVPFARITPMQQVQFIWGPRYSDVLSAMGSPAEVTVEAGIIFDRRDYKEEWTSIAEGHRMALENKGVRRVLCVIDRSCSNLSVYPIPYHVTFYESILDWVEKDRNIGLIIKAKGREGPDVASLMPRIHTRIQKLSEEGRALLLTGQQYVGEGAVASDLVVALGLNSGGLLCAMEGLPTVFWDPAQSSKGPMGDWIKRFGWSHPEVVFNNLDGMITRAQRFLENQDTDSRFGDFQESITDVDRFRDGKTGERVSYFVDSFIRSLDIGNSRSEALEMAVLNYNKHWGAERAVININVSETNKGQELSFHFAGG
tara:strand:- start:3683 stop:5635 length:1953 start_codon:yes stop_codon:yes gene_type:complete